MTIPYKKINKKLKEEFGSGVVELESRPNDPDCPYTLVFAGTKQPSASIVKKAKSIVEAQISPRWGTLQYS